MSWFLLLRNTIVKTIQTIGTPLTVAIASAGVGAVAGYGDSLLTDVINGRKVNHKAAAISATVGLVLPAAGKILGKAIAKPVGKGIAASYRAIARKYGKEVADEVVEEMNDFAIGRAVGANSLKITTKWIKHDVWNTLKRHGLQDKFKNALDNGFAKTRKGSNGIIRLTKDEIIEVGNITYSYKVKVLGNGTSHIRIYGRIDENGALLFDYLLNK